MRFALFAVAALAVSPAPALSSLAGADGHGLVRDAPQGGVVEITVGASARSPARPRRRRPARSARARGGRHRFRGLFGVDFAASTGAHRVSFETPDGATPLAWSFRVVPGRFRIQRLTVDPRFVEVPEEERERVKADRSASRRRTAAVRPSASGRRSRGPSRRARTAISARAASTTDRRRLSRGARPRGPGRDARRGAGDGRVVLAGDLYFSGGTVLLDHGGGLFTKYFHLSRIDVKEGDAVVKGARLGASGHTGRVTGPHLHWAARLHGARVNPEALLALPAWPLPGADAASLN